jgi:hypothetical protein
MKISFTIPDWVMYFIKPLILASPEFFGVAAMGCLLIAMCGSKKFANLTGTMLMLAVAGKVISLAI